MDIKRIIEPKLQNLIKGIGAVVIAGPKYCGKTYLGNKYSKSSFSYQDISEEEKLTLTNSAVLEGDKPRLIDEWQENPHIWNLIRSEVDKNYNSYNHSLYILTGSSTPFDWKKIKHNGAGRFLTLNLSTLTYAEILNLDDDKSFSLTKLIDGTQEPKCIKASVGYHQSNDMMIKGGWPQIWANKDSAFLASSIIEGLTRTNYEGAYKFYISKMDLKNILTSLARLTGSQIKDTTILEDIKNKVDILTLRKYKTILYDQDVIFDLPVWSNHNLRSKYKMRTTPKTYFCDTSLVCSLLKVKTSNNFVEDLNTAGIVFENQVIKDLMVYTQAIGAELYFFRDEKGNEIDAIIQLDDGNWIPVEIKLSNRAAMLGLEKLNKTIEKIKIEGKYSEPLFKLFITNDEESLTLKTNAFVVPHSLLKV